MFEAILLAGLVALSFAWWRTAARLAVLEEQVAALDDAKSFVPPLAAPVASVAVVRARFVEPVGAKAVADVETPAASEPRAQFERPAFEESPTDAAPAASERTVVGLFERFVGGRLLVWTGAIAMALAGLFLVRYSIELGLIGPRVRMIAAAAFGIALVAAGEIARRRYPDDARIGQALVGSGLLILYAAAYGSHILYGLITLTTAFVLMAAIAAAALGLSLRHGTPTAALGLVGGFVTPLLVGRSTGEAEPLLGYLALLNVAVLAVAVRSARPWLGWAAKLMTLGWTGWLLGIAPGDALPIGAFLLAHTVATGLAWRHAAGREEPVPSLGPTLALAQMGAVVPMADFAPVGWLLLLGFGVAGFALCERSRVLAAVPGRALIAALLIIAGHIALSRAEPLVPWAAATTLLFAGGSWWRFGRDAGRLWPTLTYCAAVAGPALLLWSEPQMMARSGWAMLFGALGLAAMVFAWRVRGGARRELPFDTALPIAAATAAGLFAVAVYIALPWLWVPAGWMLVALGLAVAGRRLDDAGVMRLAIVAGGGAVLAAAGQAQPMWEMLRGAALGVPALVAWLPTPGRALVLFAGPGAIAFLIWRVLPVEESGLRRIAGTAAGALAALAAYVLFKELFNLRTPADFVKRGFAERTLLTQGLFFAGWLLLKRPRMAWLAAPALVLTAVAAARFVWFDVLVLNPAFVRQDVGGSPALILVAYAGAAFWLWEARRRAAAGVPSSIGLALFLTAAVVGAGLLVRQLSQGAILTGGAMPRAEFYGYSLAGLILSVGLLVVGTRRQDTPLRVAGLGLLTATVLKVFVFDAAALEGLLRIASFAGLGGALIGMGKLYGTVLGRKATSGPV